MNHRYTNNDFLLNNVASAELISKKYLILFHAHLYAALQNIKQPLN